MKKLFSTTMALALLLSVSGAWAAEIQGKIQQTDSTERTIVLEDGTQLWVAEGVSMEKVTEGAVIKASYEEQDGKKVATALEVTE